MRCSSAVPCLVNVHKLDLVAIYQLVYLSRALGSLVEFVIVQASK